MENSSATRAAERIDCTSRRRTFAAAWSGGGAFRAFRQVAGAYTACLPSGRTRAREIQQEFENDPARIPGPSALQAAQALIHRKRVPQAQLSKKSPQAQIQVVVVSAASR